MPKESAPCILLADDEPLYLQSTAKLLRRAGYECRTATEADAALKILAEGDIDVAIVDLNMPGNMELQLLNEGRRRYPEIPMLVVTGAPSLTSAIDSVRLQIFDYLLKPIRIDDLLAGVRRALAGRAGGGVLPLRERRDAATAKDIGRQDATGTPLLGTSTGILNVLEVIDRIASLDVSVLVLGESGTGKELVAQAIHRSSRRSSQPFVTVDCTAIPELLFESVLFGHVKGAFTSADRDQPGLLRDAGGGTVFLDEIGELSPGSQAKLLRLLQHRTFTPIGQNRAQTLDVRFVAATNRDLMSMVKAERFRADLYYRLAVVPMEVPPLRDRGADIILLAEYILREFQQHAMTCPAMFTSAARQALLSYDWPGNVRELRNVVERAAALTQGTVIDVTDLPEVIQMSVETPVAHAKNELTFRGEALTLADREYLSGLLAANSGNVSRAAAAAGVSRQGLYKLLRKHGLDPEGFREA